MISASTSRAIRSHLRADAPQPPLESYEQWARDISGLCGRRCESEHTGSGHGKSTLCINDIGHEGPHLCDRGELERGDAG